MPTGTFISEINHNKQLRIPSEIIDRLHLTEGDKVEVMLKKIRSRRLDIKISKNPLLKLLDINSE